MLELSSFQIDLMPSLKPDAGILTNITPDHLDRHGTMENYVGVKARMFARQSAGDTAIIGVDENWGEAIADGLNNGARCRCRCRSCAPLDDGLSAPDGDLYATCVGRQRSRPPSISARMPALKGAHNWQNAAMAYARGTGAWA